ncbi:MAG: glycosyltransferase [Candidatus Eremiobacteraeota bacterium]|nr:glycosyltransferase [Candidatus Eremiobacteraeota bacterium]
MDRRRFRRAFSRRGGLRDDARDRGRDRLARSRERDHEQTAGATPDQRGLPIRRSSFELHRLRQRRHARFELRDPRDFRGHRAPRPKAARCERDPAVSHARERRIYHRLDLARRPRRTRRRLRAPRTRSGLSQCGLGGDRRRHARRRTTGREALSAALQRRDRAAADVCAVAAATLNRRVALVHDYLNQRGGAERVFAHIAAAWPEAPVYTTLYDERACGDLVARARVRTSFLDRIPLARRNFRAFAPLYPRAIESFDLSEFDLVISSTTSWAKGVRIAPGAVHVCYINTVSRFVFDYERYVGSGFSGLAARPLIASLAAWDRRAATRPSAFVANSQNVAQRIERYYGRSAYVLPCPVDVERFRLGHRKGDYFLVLARLLPYKRVDRAIDAAALAGVRLGVAGEGQALESLRRRARGTTAEVLGFVPDAEIGALVGAARAVIVPGEEDFGLVPLEANAAGTAAIALRAGGALETVVDGETGTFFREPSAESLAAVLRDFEPSRFDPLRLRAHAERFAPARFIERLRSIVREVCELGEDRARGLVPPAKSPASDPERA